MSKPADDELSKLRAEAMAEGYAKGWNEAMRAVDSHVRLALAAAKVTPAYFGERNER